MIIVGGKLSGGVFKGQASGESFFNTNSFKESATASYSIRINDCCRGNCPGEMYYSKPGGVFKGKASGESVLIQIASKKALPRVIPYETMIIVGKIVRGNVLIE